MSVQTQIEVQTSEVLQDTMPSSSTMDADGEILTHGTAPNTLSKLYRWVTGFSKGIFGEATRRNGSKRPQGFTQTITGQITSASTTVTGSSTLFTSELFVGAYIAGTAGEYREVAAIASDTSLTLVAAFSADIGSAQNFTRLQMLSERLDAMETYINAAINGDFSMWSSGTSFTTPASGAQLADNWYANYNGSIGTFVASQYAFTLGQTAVPGEPQYGLRWQQTAGGSGQTIKSLRYILKGVRSFAGQTLQVTFYAQMGSNTAISVGATQYFGTGGSPSANVVVTPKSRTILTAFARYTVTLSIPSIAGQSIGTNGDDAVYVDFNLPLNAIHDFYIGNIAFYKGTAELPFNNSYINSANIRYLQKFFSPIGQIIDFAGASVPFGYLACDGSAVSRSTYANLFAVISTIYGSGDGLTTFNVPDIRGLVRVGAGAHGTMKRADASAYNGGSVGESRNDQLQGHWHEAEGMSNTGGSGAGVITNGLTATGLNNAVVKDPISDGTNGTPRTGNETRPAEIAVLVCIKY